MSLNHLECECGREGGGGRGRGECIRETWANGEVRVHMQVDRMYTVRMCLRVHIM